MNKLSLTLTYIVASSSYGDYINTLKNEYHKKITVSGLEKIAEGLNMALIIEFKS